MPLKEGSQGSRVGSVQKALGLRSDRIFGPSTTRAVKRFQRRHGLTPDGVVGPSTWALIKRVRAAPDHVYMVVNGVRFDTSGRTGRQSRWQHDMRDPGGHVARHPPGL